MMLAGAGHLVGCMAYDYGQRHDLQLATWFFFLVVGLVTVLALWLNNQRVSQVRQEPLAKTSAATATAIAGRTAG